jgi:hypothetical protein
MYSTNYSCKILTKHNFSWHISKNTQISNFIKIRLVTAELLHADRLTGGRTDRHDETNRRFSQFLESA